MRIFAISDLHLCLSGAKPMEIFGSGWDGYLEVIRNNWIAEDEDVTLIAGDISWAMQLNEALFDIAYIGDLRGRKVLLRGNHDYWWKSISSIRSNLPHNIFAVQNDCLRFGSLLVCGSRGWIFPETNSDAESIKIFKRELIRVEISLKKMSEMRKEGDYVVAMTHFPPFNNKFQPSVVTNLFTQYNVDKVVYGHLHGNVYFKQQLRIDNTDYVISSCDLINFKPILLSEID